ncbi:MAG: ComF family protein [Alphaproteobacteria bacterium]|nr:ComF family protein [Alphaproteobacteria bacterium]MBO4644473.1 ComF family protein [Alphaproteobacteria bacterium]
MLSDMFLNALFPPVCPICQNRTESAGALCPECFSQLRFVGDNLADRAAAVVYDEVSRRLVLSLKYGDRLDLVPLLARLMHNAGGEVLKNADLLTGVPLHWKRMLSRKYNQSVVLAAEISKQSGIPLNPELLKRIKSTPKQGSRKERFKNVSKAFVLNPESNIRGKTVVLIDDVVTTGATAEACASVLLKGGAKEVRLLTFARAQKEN